MMFKYLAIGNSITKHGICSYWWNNCGMSASLQANDYFHIVKRYIASKYKIGKDINAYNFNIWEVQSLDRDETLFFLDEFLDCEMCLVTIQLGENVIDVTTYEYDFISLVNYIKKRCPQCKVFIIGDFWYSKDRGEIKKNIAKECNAIYISLSDIQNREEYMCGMNTEVYGDDGKVHNVTHAGVAKHPNDRAMAYIAQKIISRMKLYGM